MKLRHLVLAALAIASSAAFAQSKPEDQIRLRQGGMELMQRSVNTLNAMAKGDTPFNKDVAAQKAELINLLVPEIWAGGFPAGSDKGLPTRANAKVWSDAAGFKTAQDKLTAAAKKLSGVADVAALKSAMGDVADSCRGCHTEYRERSFN